MSIEDLTLSRLIGKKIQRIFMNEEFLQFITDNNELIAYTVEGDCCSTSIFYDFFGVKNLLENGKITNFKEIPLTMYDTIPTVDDFESNIMKDKKNADTLIQVYGYALTVESEKWGELTAVFSFRNYSNGYYGGELVDSSRKEVLSEKYEIFDDVIETLPKEPRDYRGLSIIFSPPL